MGLVEISLVLLWPLVLILVALNIVQLIALSGLRKKINSENSVMNSLGEIFGQRRSDGFAQNEAREILRKRNNK